MTTAEIAAYSALVVGGIVTLAYLVVLFRGLSRTKREMDIYGGSELGEVQLFDDEVFDSQETGVLWKAAIGLVLSTVVLTLLLSSPKLWYFIPFLSFGTAIAVILAFLADDDSAPAPIGASVAQPT